jgi:hypothetical protein
VVNVAIHFDLQLWEGSDPKSFESLHWMAYRLADERVLVDLTGIVLLSLKGESNWVRKTLLVGLNGGKTERLLNLGAPQKDHHWVVRPVMWSVHAAPASIFNAGTAVNAGWAVDTCNTEWDLGEPRSNGDLLGAVKLYLNLGVRDTDGILYRISFDFRGVGNLAQERDPIIE